MSKLELAANALNAARQAFYDAALDQVATEVSDYIEAATGQRLATVSLRFHYDLGDPAVEVSGATYRDGTAVTADLLDEDELAENIPALDTVLEAAEECDPDHLEYDEDIAVPPLPAGHVRAVLTVADVDRIAGARIAEVVDRQDVADQRNIETTLSSALHKALSPARYVDARGRAYEVWVSVNHRNTGMHVDGEGLADQAVTEGILDHLASRLATRTDIVRDVLHDIFDRFLTHAERVAVAVGSGFDRDEVDLLVDDLREHPVGTWQTQLVAAGLTPDVAAQVLSDSVVDAPATGSIHEVDATPVEHATAAEAEAGARADYEAARAAGPILVSEVVTYNDADEWVTVHFVAPVQVRVLDTPDADVVRWQDDRNIDPLWKVGFDSEHEDVKHGVGARLAVVRGRTHTVAAAPPAAGLATYNADGVKAEFVDLGEGTDDGGAAMLRVDFSVSADRVARHGLSDENGPDERGWYGLEGGSHCTQVPAGTPEYAQVLLLKRAVEDLTAALEGDSSPRRAAERASMMSPDDLADQVPAMTATGRRQAIAAMVDLLGVSKRRAADLLDRGLPVDAPELADPRRGWLLAVLAVFDKDADPGTLPGRLLNAQTAAVSLAPHKVAARCADCGGEATHRVTATNTQTGDVFDETFCPSCVREQGGGEVTDLHTGDELLPAVVDGEVLCPRCFDRHLDTVLDVAEPEDGEDGMDLLDRIGSSWGRLAITSAVPPSLSCTGCVGPLLG